MHVRTGGMLSCTHKVTHRLAFSIRGVPKDCTADCRAAGSLMLQKSATGTPARWKCCFCKSLSCGSRSPQRHYTAICFAFTMLHCVRPSLLLASRVCKWDASTAQSFFLRTPKGGSAAVNADGHMGTCPTYMFAGLQGNPGAYMGRSRMEHACVLRSWRESAAAALLHAM